MRELKLKYIIQLLSDIGEKSNRDAKTLEEAQKRVQKALGDTENKVGLVERALLRMGGVGGQSASRQADYLSKLALRYHDVRKAAEGAVGAMQRAAQVGAGVAAGAYAVDRMTQAPMEYSARLARMANTAYSDRDVAGRIAGKRTLNAAITAAVRVGGGTRDTAAGALDEMIASGAVSPEMAIRMLPMIMRTSTAGDINPRDLASIGVKGIQNFRLTPEQITDAFNMTIQAGQAGGFEPGNMAKWLPPAMAFGKSLGLSGLSGYKDLLTYMEAGVTTAGTKDEAGNNLVNLLKKINAPDTAKDFKKFGIDLTAELTNGRAKGVNAVDTFVGLMDRVAAKDPDYVRIKKKLDNTKDPGERRDTLEAMANLLQGSAIAQVMQDSEAMKALSALMGNRGYTAKLKGLMTPGTDAIDTGFAVMADETSFKRQQALAEATTASQVAFDKLAPTLNTVFDGAVNLGREFPVLTAAVMLTAGTLTAIAAALGGAGLAGLAMGGSGAAGAGRSLAGRVAGAAALASPWAGVAAVGATSYGLGGLFYRKYLEGTNASDLIGEGTARVAAFFGNSEAAQALRQRADYDRATNLLQGARVGSLPENLGIGNLTGVGMPGMGDGRLAVDVRVSDERTTATTTVVKQPSLVRVDAGATNPAGYAR